MGFCGNPINHFGHSVGDPDGKSYYCEGVDREEVKEEIVEKYSPMVEDWITQAGEVRTVSATGGEKGVKAQRYDLIPIHPLNLLAELYGKGAEKYAAHNFRKGYEWSKSYASAMRHMTAFWNGEDIDPEMAIPHVICAAFHMFALAEFMKFHPDFDDRFVRELREEISKLMPTQVEGP